jgi:uncharacterized protein YciI
MDLFLVDLHFTAPIDAVDRLLADHLAWLEKGHAEGRFLAWGPKQPRTGGFILARAESQTALEAQLASDPYVTGGVARSTATGWKPRFAGPGVEGLRP